MGGSVDGGIGSSKRDESIEGSPCICSCLSPSSTNCRNRSASSSTVRSSNAGGGTGLVQIGMLDAEKVNLFAISFESEKFPLDKDPSLDETSLQPDKAGNPRESSGLFFHCFSIESEKSAKHEAKNEAACRS